MLARCEPFQALNAENPKMTRMISFGRGRDVGNRWSVVLIEHI